MSLVLSLFPGIGLLDMAFEDEGFCVVRGPDMLWGGDIRRFHPPTGKFDGVIGGPPCQMYGGLVNFSWRWNRKPEHLIPEYERVVREAAPAWFVMENAPRAPEPVVTGYIVRSELLNTRWLGHAQDRERRFSFGTSAGLRLWVDTVALESTEYVRTVTGSHGGGRPRMKGRIENLTVAEALRRQGLSDDFFGARPPFTVDGQRRMVANGVPLPMGRAVARAVKDALVAAEGIA